MTDDEMEHDETSPDPDDETTGSEAETSTMEKLKHGLSVLGGIALFGGFFMFMFWPEAIPSLWLPSQSGPPREIVVGSTIEGTCADLSQNRYFAVTLENTSRLTFTGFSHMTHWLVLRSGDMASDPIEEDRGTDDDDHDVYSVIARELAPGRYVVEIRPFFPGSCVYSLTVENTPESPLSLP